MQASGHSPDDPSPGDLWYVMVRRGGLLPKIVMLDSNGIEYHTGVWNGRCFSSVPEMDYSYSDMFCLPGDGEPQRGQLQLRPQAWRALPIPHSRVVLNCSTSRPSALSGSRTSKSG
jgi:hypothetical protein